MKITGPDAGSVDNISAGRNAGKHQNLQAGTRAVSQNGAVSGELLTKQLAGLFAKRGIDILPAHFKALHAELSLLGFTSAEIDDTVIMNALMLRQHSIPISKELIETLRGKVPDIFRGISSISENARALLGDSQLTGETRAAVELLLRDINTFFKGTVSQELLSIAGDNVIQALPLKNIILNSGMAFEWQLLAWYRSGGNPERLRALMREDLKGILLNFANRAEKNPAEGKTKKKFEMLEKETHTQLRNIKNLQISNILGKHELKKGFGFELPPGGGLNHGHGIIEDTGHKDKGKEEKADSPKSFTLELDVETTKLGAVHVEMKFAGKSVSVAFGLENETLSSAAGEMSMDLRTNLTDRGYTVVSVNFRKHDNSAKRSKNRSISADKGKAEKKLDITG